MRKSLVIIGILVLSAVFLINRWEKRSSQESVFSSREGQGQESHLQVESPKPSRVITRSSFVQSYGTGESGISGDLEAVSAMLGDSQLILKDFDSYFLPDNQAITGFLRGKNREGIAWIPPGHSSVNSNGELVDRNQVPLFFHREGSMRIRIRSAGKDQKMWTSDDLVYPPSNVASRGN